MRTGSFAQLAAAGPPRSVVSECSVSASARGLKHRTRGTLIDIAGKRTLFFGLDPEESLELLDAGHPSRKSERKRTRHRWPTDLQRLEPLSPDCLRPQMSDQVKRSRGHQVVPRLSGSAGEVFIIFGAEVMVIGYFRITTPTGMFRLQPCEFEEQSS